MTEPKGGFTTAERFPCELRFGSYFSRYLPGLVVMCLIAMGLTRQLGLGLPLELVVVALLAAVLIVVNKLGFDRTWGTSELELSATGATVVRHQSRVHLPWGSISRLGKADLVTPKHLPAGSPGAKLVSWLLVSSTRRPGQAALIGDPVLGYGTIVLPIYDKSWESRRIGDWIRAYRPDLLPHR